MGCECRQCWVKFGKLSQMARARRTRVEFPEGRRGDRNLLVGGGGGGVQGPEGEAGGRDAGLFEKCPGLKGAGDLVGEGGDAAPQLVELFLVGRRLGKPLRERLCPGFPVLRDEAEGHRPMVNGIEGFELVSAGGRNQGGVQNMVGFKVGSIEPV